LSPVDMEVIPATDGFKVHERNAVNYINRKVDNSILKTRTIESLRFGLVPEHHIEQLTLGFTELNDWASNTFEKCSSGVPNGFEISGPYGTGKSHTLSLIRYLARKQGFLTARVELDGQNISLSSPVLFLNALWATLAENDLDSDSPLVSLYIKVIEKGILPTKIIRNGVDRIQNNLQTIHTLMKTGNIEKYAHIVEAIISCSDEYTAIQAKKEISAELNINYSQILLDAMVSKAVSKRGLDLIESLAGHAMLAKMAGYKGLIVTIDEFEIEYIDKKNINRVKDILNVLHQYMCNQTIYSRAPLGLYFATVDQAGHEGDPLIHEYITTDENNKYRLKVWEKEHRIHLAEDIHRMYCEAYNLKLSFNKDMAIAVEGLLSNKIENNDSGLIRSFIKWYIGILDLKYGPPEGKVV
ncbi:MAG: DUF2791 family P-loop domain-containing protein, partial [Firmicutes bacterium]|nr:DUF2791 family P-loop domain-containing protein [Bacillota bacterium]